MKLAKLNNQAEIFYSIQGEGPSMGKPAIFIRLTLCNLHCIWCDTDYTWNWKSTPFEHVNDGKKGYDKFEKSDWIIERSTEEILTEVSKYPCKRIILTGGEPLMQQKQLVDLAKALNAAGYYIEVETNGTIKPILVLDQVVDQYNVSPKLSNSNNDLKLRIKAVAMRFFAGSEKAAFKFVVNQETDLKEVINLIDEFNIIPKRVYLMPEGTQVDVLRQKQAWVTELCKAHGFNYTDRLHIHIYGDKRGV